MFELPESVRNYIADIADVDGYWKEVFRNEVLTKIDKGYRMIGLTSTGEPCSNCYYYYKSGLGYDCGNNPYHLHNDNNEIILREVSYEEYIKYCENNSWSYSGSSYATFWHCEKERIQKEKEEQIAFEEAIFADLAKLGF